MLYALCFKYHIPELAHWELGILKELNPSLELTDNFLATIDILHYVKQEVLCPTGRVWGSWPAIGSGRSVKKRMDSNIVVM
jgi:hypothetical protein